MLRRLHAPFIATGAAGCLLIAALAGCLSAPNYHYYTLDMRSSGEAASMPRPHSILVDRVRPAEALAPADIMIQKSPTEVEYYAGHQWVASLGQLVGEKLQVEFGPPDDSRENLLLQGEILAFEQVDRPGGADARVKLAISLRKEGSRRLDPPLLRKVYETSVSADAPRPAEIVRALSEAVEEIAVLIVRDAGKL